MKNSLVILISFLLVLFSACSTELRNQVSSNHLTSIKYDSIFNQDKLVQIRVFKNDKINEIRFFGMNNILRKVIKYIRVNDSILPNQFILLDENGDTIKNQSLYYDLYCINDTIANNEKYKFKVILSGHVFDSAAFYLCNYSDKFILDSANAQCSVFSMNKVPLCATVADVNTVKGWNYIRGRIDNYKNYNDLSGKEKNTHVSIYFIDSFYVE
jgi:hypothetical protein